MSFLADYLFFNEGNEAPENFHIWCALTLLSAVVQRKVYLDWGQERLHTNLYVGLIGRQGTRKTTAKNVAENIIEQHFPEIPTAASITSHQQIAKEMASEDFTRSYTDTNGQPIEIHPFIMFVNEFKNFLNVDPRGMLNWLTDVYDKPVFKARYRNQGNFSFPNPYVVLLACETPDEITTNLKMNVMTGGFARRFIPVYELKPQGCVPFPFINDKMQAVKDKVIERIKAVSKLIGPFTLEPGCREFYEEWYRAKRPPSDPMMEGFYSSKHVQLLKGAMLLTMSDHLDLRLRVETMQVMLGLLDRIEPNMMTLYSGMGRNPLAGPTERLLALVESKDGIIPEKEFMLAAQRDMNHLEIKMTLEHLKKTEQLYESTQEDKETKLKRRVLVSRKVWRTIQAVQQKGQVK